MTCIANGISLQSNWPIIFYFIIN